MKLHQFKEYWRNFWKKTEKGLNFTEQDNVQVNTESVQCISTAYGEVRITVTEISEQLNRVDQSD